jgi:undecaprenyl-diphosphatase
MDLQIVTWFASHRTAVLDVLAGLLTGLGRGGVIFVAIAAARGLTSRRLAMAAWQTLLAVLVAGVLASNVIKPAVNRPRPFTSSPSVAAAGERPSDASFPSGHAAVCVAGALLVGSTWPRARVWLWLFAALVATSRVYLGVHFPSDIAGGALLGWAVASFVRGGTLWRIDAREQTT